VGSRSERLVSSDVGKRRCFSYCSILSFRGPEAEQEKLESAMLIGTYIRAIREAKKLSSFRLGKENCTEAWIRPHLKRLQEDLPAGLPRAEHSNLSSVASVCLISTIELR